MGEKEAKMLLGEKRSEKGEEEKRGQWRMEERN